MSATGYAVVSRVPGGQWGIIAGPFPSVAEATDVARRVLRDTPRGEAIVGYCPWDQALGHDQNVNAARTTGAIERVT